MGENEKLKSAYNYGRDSGYADGFVDGYKAGVKDVEPKEQQEIIRCRDCKHWDKTWTNDWAPDYHYCPIIDGTRNCDFYCADAERRMR